MTHMLQPAFSDAHEPFDFNQIFIGREQQIREFERTLREWKHIMAQRDPHSVPSPDLPSPRNKLQGLVVMVYGRGGFGKSTLLNRYYEVARGENEHGPQGLVTLCGPIDWEFVVEGRRATYNPSRGQTVDPLAYFHDLCAQFASHLKRQPKDFHTYQQAVSAVEKAKKEANKLLEGIKREKDGLGGAVASASVEFIANMLSAYVPGSKLVVENEKVKKGAESLLQLSAEQIARLSQRFHNRLGARMSDYLDPARRLGEALGTDLRHFAVNYPILIFFDTYEEIDEGDAFLRLIMGAAGLRVGWVIAGRDNLWSGPGQRERSPFPEYGYKDLLPFDRGLSINFNSEDVGTFTSDNIREYFEQLCQRFPGNPPLPALTDEEIGRIWDVTKGIPLAIKIAAGLYSEQVSIDQITEEVEGRKEIIDKMVYRYLQHTRIDEEERHKLYAIALLRRTDQPMTMAAALGLTPEEAKTQYKETLNHLHRRYSFIFTEKGEPSLHQEVRYFLRLFLLERRKQPETLAINVLLKEAHQAALDALEQQRGYQTLKERMQDEEWAGIYLDLAEQLFWIDPHEGFRYLLPFMVAGSVYKREVNEEAELIGDFFADTLSVREQNRWMWAARSLVFSYSYNPLTEELQGLEELSKLFSQQVKLPVLLNYPKELQAALWWRLGEAYLTSDAMKAVQSYEKASNQLPEEEEELKEVLAEAWYQRGTDLLSEKRYEESISALSRAIELSPTHVNAYNNRGLVYYEQKKYDEAMADCEAIIHLDPNYVFAYYNRGLVYFAQQGYIKALADFDSTIRLDPNYTDAYYNRGLIYSEQKEYPRALADFDSTIRLDPNYTDAYYNRGLAYNEQKEYTRAVADFDSVIHLDSKYTDAYFSRGVTYYTQKEYASAIADYDTALRLNPDYTTAYYNRGLAYYDQQQYASAIADFDSTIRLDPKYANACFFRGVVYYTQKEYASAIADFDSTIRLDPNYTDAYYNLGLAHYDQQEYARAITDFDSTIRLDPKYTNAYFFRGVVYYTQKEYASAIADFDSTIRLDPNYTDAYYNRGLAHYDQKEYTRAVDDYDSVIHLDSKYTDAYFSRGVTYYTQKEYASAIADYDTALRLNPDYTAAYYNRGLAYYDQQQYASAIADFDSTIRLDPKYTDAYFSRGAAYDEQKEYTKAIADFDSTIHLDPDYTDAYFYRGVIYYAQQEYTKAIADYGSVLHLNPNYTDAYYNRGLAYYAQQEHTKAIADYDSALRLNPNYTDAYYNRGLAYYEQQEYANAIADFDSVIRLDSHYTDAYNYRGLIYYEQKEYAKAIANYDAALNQNSDYAVVYYNRGLVYNDQQEYARAIADFTNAIQFGYEEYAYLMRGYVYLRLKDIKKAAGDFEQAAITNPNDVNIVWMPIFVSLTEGRPGLDVAEQLEKIAALDPQRIEAQVSLGIALGLRGKLKEGLAQIDEALEQNAKSPNVLLRDSRAQDGFFWKGMLCAYYYPGRPQLAMEALEKALSNGLPPILLRPLYWLQTDNPSFFEHYARPLLERYGV